ncbi:hypothetical protein RB2083_1544 [Rhodobacteraceae bacterium HTCC2083]|nr:hypothetical protein RB2083_1544 [Rhodobacteraceae bacterium HTCC2083]
MLSSQIMLAYLGKKTAGWLTIFFVFLVTEMECRKRFFQKMAKI